MSPFFIIFQKFQNCNMHFFAIGKNPIKEKLFNLTFREYSKNLFLIRSESESVTLTTVTMSCSFIKLKTNLKAKKEISEVSAQITQLSLFTILNTFFTNKTEQFAFSRTYPTKLSLYRKYSSENSNANN